MERKELMQRIDRAVDFGIRHHRWVVPLAWLGLVSLAALGAAVWGGFDLEALPWVTGVLAVIGAGVIGGAVAVSKGRREGWSGILAWLVLPILQLGSLLVVDEEGWAPTFFATVLAILLTLALAALAIASSMFDAQAGSRWDRVANDRPSTDGSPPDAEQLSKPASY